MDAQELFMCAETRLKWFACLFGNVHRSIHGKGSTAKATNRTVIVLTAKPIALLTLMNASEEKEIADAAEKAKKLLETHCEKMYDGMEIPKRFAMLCSIGPILDYELAKEITHQWIKSRGGHPRTSYAQSLATMHNVKCTVDLEGIFSLSGISVTVKILSVDERGTVVEIRPKCIKER